MRYWIWGRFCITVSIIFHTIDDYMCAPLKFLFETRSANLIENWLKNNPLTYQLKLLSKAIILTVFKYLPITVHESDWSFKKKSFPNPIFTDYGNIIAPRNYEYYFKILRYIVLGAYTINLQTCAWDLLQITSHSFNKWCINRVPVLALRRLVGSSSRVRTISTLPIIFRNSWKSLYTK